MRSLPAPVGGWNARDAVANMKETDAVVLDNYFPTASDVMGRKGFANHMTGFSAPVESLLNYTTTTEKLFACAGTAIYDATAAGAVATAVVTGLTNSRWQHVNITTAGENFVFSAELPWSAWIEWADRQIDSFLPPHVVPIIAPYPAIVVTASAELAATYGLGRTGGSTIDLGAKLDAIGARLTRWAKGLPLRGTAASNTSPVNLAITASAGAVDPRGWASAGNTVLP